MAKTSTERAVGQEGSLREGLETAIRERVREIIELALEEEVESALGAPRSQRVAERSGYRHGRKSRRLTLRTGTVRVEVPRARLVDSEGGEREWQSQLVPRYRRSSREIEQSVLGVYLAGTNTRRIRGALATAAEGGGERQFKAKEKQIKKKRVNQNASGRGPVARIDVMRKFICLGSPAEVYRSDAPLGNTLGCRPPQAGGFGKGADFFFHAQRAETLLRNGPSPLSDFQLLPAQATDLPLASAHGIIRHSP